MPLGLCYLVADAAGEIWYLLHRRLREALDFNLSRLRGLETDAVARRRLARRNVRSFARVVTEFLYMPRLKGEEIDRLVDVESFRDLRNQLDRRAVFVSGHVGNWEAGAAVAASIGIDLYVVVFQHPDPRIARIFTRRREARGLKVVSVREAARGMRAALADRAVGIVGDRDFSHRGARAHLFGVPTSVPSGYAALAIQERVPVIPAFCLKGADGRYRLDLHRPIYDPAEDPGGRTEPESVVSRFIRIYEKVVENSPEQWYLFEKLGDRPGDTG
jgi:KDO2-lipid IV(A) lauroyltransferase